MAFYLFRALQKTGLYQWTKQYWNLWTRMIDDGATTCVEDGVGQRSDCHAWGALILYELPCAVLGVQPGQAGYQTVRIALTDTPEPASPILFAYKIHSPLANAHRADIFAVNHSPADN